jgi:hypothetical protein
MVCSLNTGKSNDDDKGSGGDGLGGGNSDSH